MEKSIFCRRRNLAARRLDRMGFQIRVHKQSFRIEEENDYSLKINTTESFTVLFSPQKLVRLLP